MRTFHFVRPLWYHWRHLLSIRSRIVRLNKIIVNCECCLLYCKYYCKYCTYCCKNVLQDELLVFDEGRTSHINTLSSTELSVTLWHALNVWRCAVQLRCRLHSQITSLDVCRTHLITSCWYCVLLLDCIVHRMCTYATYCYTRCM